MARDPHKAYIVNDDGSYRSPSKKRPAKVLDATFWPSDAPDTHKYYDRGEIGTAYTDEGRLDLGTITMPETVVRATRKKRSR